MLIYHGLIFIFNKRWIWKVLEWWWIFRAKIYNKMLCMLQWNTRLLKTEITVFHVTFVEANEQKPTRRRCHFPSKVSLNGMMMRLSISMRNIPRMSPSMAAIWPRQGPWGPKLRSNDRDNNVTVTQPFWAGLLSPKDTFRGYLNCFQQGHPT